MALLFFASGVGTGYAAPARAQTAQQRMEFASFIDGFFAGIQRDWHIPGMAFVAVRDGEIHYLKGYGIADLASGMPVSADATLFRVGAISKAFTATAVLQLVEKGRLALDEDVNPYLRRWTLPDFSGQPVTLRHLLTHTAGFDDRELEIGAATSQDERAFASRLPKLMPARYAEAGRYYSYSGMSYALLGSIVERYSRQPFHAAVEKHIFQPLLMKNSTFSPSAAQMTKLATGYDTNGNGVPYAFRYDMPAIGMSASAQDMGRFMLAQLGEGVLGRGRILQPMYAGSMMRTHFTPHPTVDGTALSYLEKRIGGLRTLQISGHLPGYSSFMMLIPEKRFGLFYAANVSGLGFEGDLAAAVVAKFFPPAAADGAGAVVDAVRHAEVRTDVAGYYRLNRISRHTAEKVTKLLAPQLRIAVDGDEILLAHVNGPDKSQQRWRRVDDSISAASGDLYVRGGQTAGERLFFQRDEAGRVRTLVLGDVYHTYDKLRKAEWYSWQNVFIACFALIAIFSAMGTFLGVTINRGKLPWEKGLRAATELWTISVIFCLIQSAFVIGLLFAGVHAGENFVLFVPYQVKALFVLPLAGGLLLAWFWFRIFGNMLNQDHHWAEKVFLALMALGETGYMLFLVNWQLLGFMF